MYIIQECGIEKGKGIVGKCCYAWDGNKQKVVLLPEVSDIYQTNNKSDLNNFVDFDKKLKEGYTYLFKNGKQLIYMGKHSINKTIKNYYYSYDKKSTYDVFTNDKKYCTTNKTTIIKQSEESVSNYSELVDALHNHVLFNDFIGYELADETDDIKWNKYYLINNKILKAYNVYDSKILFNYEFDETNFILKYIEYITFNINIDCKIYDTLYLIDIHNNKIDYTYIFKYIFTPLKDI